MTTALTREDILTRKMVDAVHVDYSRSESAWMGNVEGVPRLSVARGRDKAGNFLRWYVDAKHVRDLDAALAVINGTMTLEDAMPPPEGKPAPKPQKFSIDAQIEEVRYEIAQRKTVYERISTREPKRRSELEYHLHRMEAVLRTLEWVRDNRAELIGKPVPPAATTEQATTAPPAQAKEG